VLDGEKLVGIVTKGDVVRSLVESSVTATDRRWPGSRSTSRRSRNNVRALKALTRPGTRFMAVVKADGYGHGAVPVARAALVAVPQISGGHGR